MRYLIIVLLLMSINSRSYTQDIVYSTFIGGTKEDIPDNIIIDVAGYLYLSGTTKSNDFPVTKGAYDETFNGGLGEFPIASGTEDIFLLKYNLINNSVEYCTYLGGAQGPDFAWSMKVDSKGNIYLGGNTGASDYPITSGVYDSIYNGSNDRHSEGFLTKISREGSQLLFSTFFPNVGDFEIGSNGKIYIVGSIDKAEQVFQNSYDTTFNGGRDIYIAQLNQDASQLEYPTYLGRSGDDRINESIYLDNSFNIYFSGSTTSSDLPVTDGSTYSGTDKWIGDGYIGKFNLRENKLEFLSYFGGGKDDEITNLLVKEDTIFVLGRTVSSDLPVTDQAFSRTFNGGKFDFFLASFSAQTGQMYACTYLGGDNYENQRNLTIDNSGKLIITGNTNSTNFPTTEKAFNKTYNGGSSATFWMGDAIFVKMSPKLDKILYSTFIGGSNDENSIIALPTITSNYILVGATMSGNFPITNDALDNSINGDRDIFILYFNPDYINSAKTK